MYYDIHYSSPPPPPPNSSPPDKLGIIGEPASKFDPATLKQLETLSDSEVSESCSEDQDVSEIIDDDAIDDFT